MHRSINATNVCFLKSSLNIIVYFMGKIWQIQMQLSKLNSQHVVLISHKFHGDWPHCYRTIRGKVSVIVYAYRQVRACKSNGHFFRHKNQLDALIQSAYDLVGL